MVGITDASDVWKKSSSKEISGIEESPRLLPAPVPRGLARVELEDLPGHLRLARLLLSSWTGNEEQF